MAKFKKIPDSDSVPGPFDAFTSEVAGQFAATYWPVVLGGVILFVLILMGKERVADSRRRRRRPAAGMAVGAVRLICF